MLTCYWYKLTVATLALQCNLWLSHSVNSTSSTKTKFRMCLVHTKVWKFSWNWNDVPKKLCVWKVRCDRKLEVWKKTLEPKFFFKLSTFHHIKTFLHTNFQLFRHIVLISTKLIILAWTKHTPNLIEVKSLLRVLFYSAIFSIQVVRWCYRSWSRSSSTTTYVHLVWVMFALPNKGRLPLLGNISGNWTVPNKNWRKLIFLFIFLIFWT